MSTKWKHCLPGTLEHCRQVRSGPLYLKPQFALQTLQFDTLPYKQSLYITSAEDLSLLGLTVPFLQATCSWSSHLPWRSTSLESASLPSSPLLHLCFPNVTLFSVPTQLCTPSVCSPVSPASAQKHRTSNVGHQRRRPRSLTADEKGLLPYGKDPFLLK